MELKVYEAYIEEMKKEMTEQLIERMVTYRKELGMTQQDIADKTGIKRPNIARVESGRTTPTLEVVLKIADSMNLDVQIDFVPRK